jgi:Protein of unknown function (DUF3019)
MKRQYQFILALFLLCIVKNGFAESENPDKAVVLSIKPKECVVLKEGDKCYAKVRIHWQLDNSGSFCLLRTPGDIQLQCWKGASEGNFSENLVMNESVEYYLVDADSSAILIKKSLTLSWVYEKSMRSEHTWRLF